MAVTILIGGVDVTSYVRRGRLRVDKNYGVETATLEVFDWLSTAGAYRPAGGAEVLIHHDADLLFGGTVIEVTDQRVTYNAGTVTVVRCRDFTRYAEQTFLPMGVYGPEDSAALVNTLATRYLVPKGCTIITAGTGGPVAPEIKVDKPTETLASFYTSITKNLGWFWRINGDKQFAFIPPGFAFGPSALSAANGNVLSVSPGLEWRSEFLDRATRYWSLSGVPEGEKEPVYHTETRIADGSTNYFPVNVIPNRSLVLNVNLEAGYAGGATSIALKNGTAGVQIRANNSFRIAGHFATYVVQSNVTIDADGRATVTIAPGLGQAVVDSEEVKFAPEMGIVLLVNGVDTNLFGSPWAWDAVENGVYAGVTPPVAATEVVIGSRITRPVHMRVWETATPVPQAASGAFDYALVEDAEIDGGDFDDLPAMAAWLRAKLAAAVTPPKVVTLETHQKGWYPLLKATLTFPERLLDGVYLVQSVSTQDMQIKDGGVVGELRYRLELIEGDTLGGSWIDLAKGIPGGILWGAINVTAGIAQAVVEVLIKMQAAKVAQATVETVIQRTPTGRIAQAAVETLIDSPTPATAPRIRQAKTASASGAGTSISASFDVQPKVGSLVVIGVTIDGVDVDLSAITDNQSGNTYAFRAGETGGLGDEGAFFSGKVVGSSGTFTITVDPPGAGTIQSIVIAEIIDWHGTTEVESSDHARGASSTTVPSVSVTSTVGALHLYLVTSIATSNNTVFSSYGNYSEPVHALISSHSARQCLFLLMRHNVAVGVHTPAFTLTAARALDVTMISIPPL